MKLIKASDKFWEFINTLKIQWNTENMEATIDLFMDNTYGIEWKDNTLTIINNIMKKEEEQDTPEWLYEEGNHDI